MECDCDNKIVYIKGDVDSAIITRVLEIDLQNETKLSELRNEIYAFERSGIRQKTGGIFKVHTRANVGAEHVRQRNGFETNRYNDGLGADRGAGRRKTYGAKEIYYLLTNK